MSATDRIEAHLTITDHGATPVDLLAAETGLSKQRIKQAMLKGAVWLTRGKGTQRLRRASKALQRGDRLDLYYDAKILAVECPTPLLIADLGGYSVWYKPADMLAQGSPWGDHCALSRWAEQQLLPQRPVFVVHRLDREADGLMLLAHQPAIAAALTRLFQDREMEKHYRVIVHGCFPAPMAEPTDDVLMAEAIDGKPAQTRARLLAYDAHGDCSLLEVSIETGRKHQIRRHLADRGFPVVGDPRYGRAGDTARLRLTAYSLAFICPLSRQRRQFQLAAELIPALPRN